MSAPWSYLLIAVFLLDRLDANESSDHKPTQCKKPTIENVGSLSEDQEYYDPYESVSVRCKSGYSPSSDSMMCYLPGAPQEWIPSSVTCIAQCRRPGIEHVKRFSEDDEYFDKYDTVTAWCKPGYNPQSITMTCMRPGTNQEWIPTATCTAQCKRPAISNVYRLLADERYYNHKEVLSIICKAGYHPSSDTMRCDHPGSAHEWTPPTVTCTARCKRPVIRNMLNPYPFQMSYNEGEEIGVHCNSGSYPSYDKTRCDCPLTPREWSPDITCIDVEVRERVTSTSASFWMSCPPSLCPPHWRFSAECCDFHFGICQSLNASGHVTFAGLQPSSQYSVTITLHNNQTQYKLRMRLIRTDQSAPGRIDIVEFPTMQDGTIRWSMPYNWGNVAGFQMTVSARRNYDQSFGTDDSTWFPSNVTEYKIPLRYGTNHTITIRAFTSSGAETTREWFTNTKIGDPPQHPENTLREDATLQLHPVLAVNGPISSYEVIVYLGQEKNLSADCLRFTSTPSKLHYTAAVLPAETLTAARTFILGDDQHYNGFHNAPLTPNHKYSVYIRVTSRWNEVEKMSCALAGVIGGKFVT